MIARIKTHSNCIAIEQQTLTAMGDDVKERVSTISGAIEAIAAVVIKLMDESSCVITRATLSIGFNKNEENVEI